MSNRLAGETSPYLLQHANNPVDWHPWGREALARATAEDKPIFLSIGYAACHWCHVMERESFEDAATAADLNRDFVAIKVDREERPDLDQVYMGAVQAMTGQGATCSREQPAPGASSASRSSQPASAWSTRSWPRTSCRPMGRPRRRSSWPGPSTRSRRGSTPSTAAGAAHRSSPSR